MLHSKDIRVNGYGVSVSSVYDGLPAQRLAATPRTIAAVLLGALGHGVVRPGVAPGQDLSRILGQPVGSAPLIWTSSASS